MHLNRRQLHSLWEWTYTEDICLDCLNESSQKTVVFTVGMNTHRKTVALTVNLNIYRWQLSWLWEWIFTEDICQAPFTVNINLPRRQLPLLLEWLFTKDSCLHRGNDSSWKIVAFTVEMNHYRSQLPSMGKWIFKRWRVLVVGMNLHERHLPSLLECIFTEDSCIHWGDESSFALTVWMNLQRRQLPSLWEWLFTEDRCLHYGNESSQKTAAFNVWMNLNRRHLHLL